MSGIDQIKTLVGDLGHDGVEFSGEFYLRLDGVELCDSFDGGFDSRKLLAKRFSEVKQNARDLAFLVPSQVLQLVVGFDRLERLDVDGLAAGRKAVSDARDLAAVVGLDGNYEAVIANRDDLVLYGVAGGGHRPLERLCQPRPLRVYLTAQLGEFG